MIYFSYKMYILGVDPALRKSGWSILQVNSENHLTYLESGLCITNNKFAMEKRYEDIFDFFIQLIQQYPIAQSFIEQTFVNNNNKTSLNLFGARVVISLALQKNSIPIVNLSSTAIKKYMTGNGRSEKKLVADALKTKINNLPDKFLSEDCSDATAAAYTGFSLEQEKLKILEEISVN